MAPGWVGADLSCREGWPGGAVGMAAHHSPSTHTTVFSLLLPLTALSLNVRLPPLSLSLSLAVYQQSAWLSLGLCLTGSFTPSLCLSLITLLPP